MRYVLSFGALALIGALLAWNASSHAARVASVMVAIAFCGVAAGYGFLGPRIFAKSTQGVLSPTGFWVFLPYHLLYAGGLLVVRHFTREPTYDEIVPGLLLGRMLTASEARAMAERACAVLDLTGELSENACLRRAERYRCIPLLDGMAPSERELEEGLDFIARHLREGSVYVHCWMGHGRSATFVVGHLLREGGASSIDEALAFVRTKRPKVRLSPRQRARLESWWRTRSTHRGT